MGELAIARHYLQIQAYETYLTVTWLMSDTIECSGLQITFGIKAEPPFSGVLTKRSSPSSKYYVAEVYIIKLQSAYLLQLLLDATTPH
jgi:hypothetical protein